MSKRLLNFMTKNSINCGLSIKCFNVEFFKKNCSIATLHVDANVHIGHHFLNRIIGAGEIKGENLPQINVKIRSRHQGPFIFVIIQQ